MVCQFSLSVASQFRSFTKDFEGETMKIIPAALVLMSLVPCSALFAQNAGQTSTTETTKVKTKHKKHKESSTTSTTTTTKSTPQ